MLTKRIIPCLDVKDGRVVKGVNFVSLRDAGDPVECARTYNMSGADELVFLDITATLESRDTTVEMARRVAEQVFIPFTVGGGIRTCEDIQALLNAGADKVSLNSAAVKDPEFTRKAIEKYGDKVAIGIDAHDGYVSVNGWTSDSTLKAVDFALKCKAIGAKTVVFTDIARDGMLTGPATQATKEMVEKTGLDVIASGGIGSNEDVELIKTSGCAGVIIGKAIYEGKVDLAKCLRNV